MSARIDVDRPRQPWKVRLSGAVEVSWHVGAGVSAFGLGGARTDAVAVGGGRVLQTSDGASVNCSDVHFNPHAHGTHVETIAHVTDDGLGVGALPPCSWLTARLITVPPVRLGDVDESGPSTAHRDDMVLTGASLRQCGPLRDLDALAVRTSADFSADPCDFSGTNPPYFTAEAMAMITALDVRWLVVELPSIDREDDGGTTPNHRRWWGLPDGSHAAADATFSDRCVIELARFAGVADGDGLLGVFPGPFLGDAAPCRLLWAAQ